MKMRAHELHPTTIHLPLTFLPLAATLDVAAVIADSERLDELGRKAWAFGVGAALVAGFAGAAASQEVRMESKHAQDMMFLHGMGNLAIVIAGAGMAFWRTARCASALSATIGVGAVLAAVYTSYLGGEMVYAHGIGIKSMPVYDAHGMGDSPALFSREAVPRLFVDGIKGFGWLFARGFRYLARGERIDASAAGFGTTTEERLGEMQRKASAEETFGEQIAP